MVPGWAEVGRVEGRGAPTLPDPADGDCASLGALATVWRIESARIMASTSGSTSANESATLPASDSVGFGLAGFGAAVVDGAPCSIELQALSESETRHTATNARTELTCSASAGPENYVGLVTYDLAMSENLRHLVKNLYAMDAVVRRVPEDAWDLPSPCAN